MPADLRTTLSVLRSAVGVGAWVAPGLGGRLFGLGDANDDARAAAMTRLFGVRDLVLAQALRHPEPAVRREVLKANVVVDCIDVVAGLVAWRSGAPRSAVVGVTGGAAAFAALGALALRAEG